MLFELSLPTLSGLLYHRTSNLINALEGECLCLCEISVNVNKLFIVICVIFTLSLQCFCCLFIPSFIYTDVVAIFLYIRWSCQQVHCCVFVAFVYLFNSTISISGTICTYIVDHYKPSVRVTTYFLIPLMLCVLILYMSGRIYRFSLLSCQKSCLRNIFFIFSFSWRCLTWGLNSDLMSRLWRLQLFIFSNLL